ncbi:MAG: hypothetical protein Q9168_003938 [Polycauliona sp. 1 TL-2023]
MPPGYLQQDKGPMLVKVIWIFASLALIVVCLQFWTRLKVLRQSGLEDVFMLLAWVFSLVYGALLTASVYSGLGKHPAAIGPTALARAIELYSKAIPFGMLSVTLPMFAVAIVLDNITAPSIQQRRLLYAFPTLNLVIRVVNVILVFASCPPPGTAKGIHTSSKCFSPTVAFRYVAAVCILVRVGYLPGIYKFDDFTYASVDYTVWVVIEANIFIITSCIPRLRPFVKHLRQKFNDRGVSNVALTPKKSERNSEITVPASSISLNRMKPQCASSITRTEPSSSDGILQKEESLRSVPPKSEDVEKQDVERWHESNDTSWNTEEAEAPRDILLDRDGDPK